MPVDQAEDLALLKGVQVMVCHCGADVAGPLRPELACVEVGLGVEQRAADDLLEGLGVVLQAHQGLGCVFTCLAGLTLKNGVFSLW